MNILLIGPPGVGKGTQAQKLIDRYGLSYLTTGNLLRAEAKEETDLGQEIKGIISSGKLVTDGIVNQLVKKNIEKFRKNILFDGFPRTIEQAKKLDELLSGYDQKLDIVINMVLSDTELTKRITGRYVCASCSAVYNRYFINTVIPGQCNFCNGKEFITRFDDQEEVIKKRLEIFHKENKNIIDYYSNRPLLVDIHCDGSVKEITERIFEKIQLVTG